MTLTTYGALLWAALVALPALMQRFGSAPIAAAQGTSVFAAAATPNAAAHKTDADQPAVRKDDHRVPPRGRPL
jgi:preprotein translocase subunit SecY